MNMNTRFYNTLNMDTEQFIQNYHLEKIEIEGVEGEDVVRAENIVDLNSQDFCGENCERLVVKGSCICYY